MNMTVRGTAQAEREGLLQIRLSSLVSFGSMAPIFVAGHVRVRLNTFRRFEITPFAELGAK